MSIRNQLPFLALACSTLAFAQSMAPALPTPTPAATPGFPAPAYTPVGAGAPVVGQPGPQAPPPLARSPNTRVLPPTAEAGLWAADELRAAKRPTQVQPDVDELLLSQPSPGTPELSSCRERVRRASRASGLEESRHNLPRTPRECLTARLLLHCFHREQYEFERSLGKTPRTAAVLLAIERRDKEGLTTMLWRERLCQGFQSLPFMESLNAAVVAHLERQFPRPEAR